VIQTLTVKANQTTTVVSQADSVVNTPTNTPVPSETPAQTEELPADTPTPTETQIPPTETSALRDSAQVYWDLSHTPRKGSDGSYEPSGVFSNLTSTLADANIQVQSGSGAITSVNLDQYDAVVVSATSSYGSSYSPVEAAAIGEYVERGGGLIILAEDSSFPNYIAEVARYFGVTVGLSTGVYDVFTDSSQSITEGIKSLYFYNGGNIKVGSTTYVLIQQKVGEGRLVVIGDSNLFDNRWLPQADNKAFALNVFRWVAFMKE
jgi:hypothetical protein